MLRPSLFLFGLFLVVISAGASASELEVLRVDFGLVDQPGTSDSWYEVAVTFSVEKGSVAAGGHPRFADEVAVAFSLATESSRSGRSVFAFYSARAEYPTLEVGQHVARFYLAPELVRRDRIKGEPYAFEVRVECGDGLAASLASRNLGQPAALESFRSGVDEGDSGALRLAFETPFAWSYLRDTPNARVRSSEKP